MQEGERVSLGIQPAVSFTIFVALIAAFIYFFSFAVERNPLIGLGMIGVSITWLASFLEKDIMVFLLTRSLKRRFRFKFIKYLALIGQVILIVGFGLALLLSLF